MNINRRSFLKTTGAALMATAFPVGLVKVAFGAAQDFTFAYISDAHIQHIKGNKFVRNWDMGLIRSIREANLLTPRPDFFMFGGDLAQLGHEGRTGSRSGNHVQAQGQGPLCDWGARLLP